MVKRTFSCPIQPGILQARLSFPSISSHLFLFRGNRGSVSLPPLYRERRTLFFFLPHFSFYLQAPGGFSDNLSPRARCTRHRLESGWVTEDFKGSVFLKLQWCLFAAGYWQSGDEAAFSVVAAWFFFSTSPRCYNGSYITRHSCRREMHLLTFILGEQQGLGCWKKPFFHQVKQCTLCAAEAACFVAFPSIAFSTFSFLSCEHCWGCAESCLSAPTHLLPISSMDF